MKEIYDFSALEGIFKTPEANALIPQVQDSLRKDVHGVVFRQMYVDISPDNFTTICGLVYLHVKRVFSLKTYKPVKDIYTVAAYKLGYNTRKCVWDEYENVETAEAKLYQVDEIESVYTDGSPA